MICGGIRGPADRDPAAARSYFRGDFNYDGVVDSDDFFIIDANFHAHGPPLIGAAPAGVGSVPEPGGISLIFAAFCSATRRRRV